MDSCSFSFMSLVEVGAYLYEQIIETVSSDDSDIIRELTEINCPQELLQQSFLDPNKCSTCGDVPNSFRCYKKKRKPRTVQNVSKPTHRKVKKTRKVVGDPNSLKLKIISIPVDTHVKVEKKTWKVEGDPNSSKLKIISIPVDTHAKVEKKTWKVGGDPMSLKLKISKQHQRK